MRAVLAACLLPFLAPAGAMACDVTKLGLEDKIAARSELQRSANEQTVRDLRTLRDAAIVLDAYKFEAECERLVTIVKTLTDDPAVAIEQSGDTDEDKAESIEQSREPKKPADKR